ncbi:metal-dependent transcriptional regulator [Methanoculleus receptaculi]|jgi:DtxR family Mn-dependent transcriptional regulator|uniref:Iron dependent repressor, metal binding and dimerization domain protein n=1 Tax=Methanoculleus receptaculi TaxID=394967 RepID=A0AAX4FWF2_9EURY|nr:iron dependent repressor, metal binding and dimerization domain protein [Methanoculleus receptaculi]WOX58110.1 iron dependent repressor, metal binding and dimerization domain protein [Methanoculleus receptaculi]
MRHRGCRINLSRRVEDYLEAILNVTLEKGYARTKDVARELDVSPSTVVEMFRKLGSMGFVDYRRYEGVVLLPAGREVAEAVKFRHDTLKEFLKIIHVPEKIANTDACYMEHELHPTTIRQIRLLVEALRSDPEICERIQNTGRSQGEQQSQ